jgi:DNA uptake protein ComE-like DNA-binding protein
MMRIKRTLLSGTALLACCTLTACASGQTKVEKQTTEQSSTSQYVPPAEPQQQPPPPQPPQASAGSPVVNSDLAASNGASTNLDQTPIGKTQEQAAGSVGYQQQKQVVTTETENRALPTVQQSTLKADINRMNATDFAALGVPKNVADSIIRSRDERGGQFTSVDDLKQVPGMSTAWVDRNRDRLGISTG